MSDLLADQAKFCSTVGATTCTLLWKVLHHNGAVDTILSGVSVAWKKYLQIADCRMK